MTDRRVVILGFMGCGKTTAARELARQLECNFIDLDSFITQRERRSPAEIIPAEGESAFRRIESAALNDVLMTTDARVIALGGGTWTIPANRTLIALHDCLSVWLDAPFELCWERIQTNRDRIRPLAPNRETAKERYESRLADYALSERRITTDHSDTTQTLVEQILRLM